MSRLLHPPPSTRSSVNEPQPLSPVDILSGPNGTPSHSSPVKSSRVPVTLTGTRTLPEAVDKDDYKRFVTNHLTAAPPKHVWWDYSCDTLLRELKKTGDKAEPNMYPLACQLLTHISEKIFGCWAFIGPRLRQLLTCANLASLPEVSRPEAPLFFGPVWGRRTFVWNGKLDGETFIIKDAYRDDARRFCEGLILADIHNKGFFPGVVHMLGWGFVRNAGKVITTIKLSDAHVPYREKTRLASGNVGARFKKSETVVYILVCMGVSERPVKG
jgi:hypothetical protein